MTEERRQITGHILACGTQIMWGATFVSTKVLLNYFLPAEVLFTRAVLAFLALLIFYPHHLKLKNPDRSLCLQVQDYSGSCCISCWKTRR